MTALWIAVAYLALSGLVTMSLNALGDIFDVKGMRHSGILLVIFLTWPIIIPLACVEAFRKR